MSRPRSLVLIANPTAGRMRGGLSIASVAEELRRVGATLEVETTAARGDAERTAARYARKSGVRIVVAGGDGTLNEVVNGLGGDGAEVALIPCGTANVVARDAFVPRSLPEACSLAVRGDPQPFDVGVLNERLFILGVGVGADAALVHAVSSATKHRLGKGAYALAAMREMLRAKPMRVRVTMGSEQSEEPYEVDAYSAMVCNTLHYAGAFTPSSGASPHDGLLDFYVVQAGSRLGMLRFLVDMARGRADRSCAATAWRASGCRFETTPIAPVQADGDSAGWTPAEISIRPGGLRLVAGTAPATSVHAVRARFRSLRQKAAGKAAPAVDHRVADP